MTGTLPLSRTGQAYAARSLALVRPPFSFSHHFPRLGYANRAWEDALASSPEPPHSQGRGAQAQRRYVAAYPPVFLLTTSRGIQTRCRRDKACQGVTPHANGGPTSLRTTHANAVQVRSPGFLFFLCSYNRYSPT